jgi:hypothetical protein
MSTPLDRGYGHEPPSAYAPKGERKGSLPRRQVPRLAIKDQTGDRDRERYTQADAGPGENPAAVEDPKRDVVIDRFRVPRSLEPTMLPEPRGSSTLGTLVWLGAAIAAATVVALLVVGKLPGWNSATPEQAAGSTGATESGPVEAPGPSARTSPRLTIDAAASGAVDDLIPLGISLTNADNGDAVVLNGLPAGSNITSGRPSGPSGWLMFAFELGNAAIRPPLGFVGAADVTVELRRGDRTVDNRTLHLEWTGAPPRATTVAVTAPPIIAVSTRRLPPEEVAVLVRRGEDLVASGDLAAARLLLQRAAEAGDARAALALAATYDPVVLEHMRTQGIASDAGLARAWYEKAKQFGSAEASRRLEVLAASRDR